MTTYNGITLRADSGPYVVTAISPTQHFYTDTALSSAVTLPATITTTTTWYCAAAYANVDYTFTVKSVDGSDISPAAIRVGTTGDTFLRPEPRRDQLAADVGVFPYGLTRVITTGGYYGPQNTPSHGATAAGTGVMTAVPFWVPAPFTADRIGVEVTATAATAVVRLGIYLNNAATDKPGTLALDAGTVDAASATGAVEATISYAFERGLYWLAAVSQVASATLRTVGNGHLAPVVSTALVGASGGSGCNGYYLTSITGALADWSGGTASLGMYRVMVRAA